MRATAARCGGAKVPSRAKEAARPTSSWPACWQAEIATRLTSMLLMRVRVGWESQHVCGPAFTKLKLPKGPWVEWAEKPKQRVTI